MPLPNDLWLVTIIGGLISAPLAGLVLLYLSMHRRKQISRADLMNRVNNADELLKLNDTHKALLTYEDLLGKGSRAEYSDIHARIKNNQGICYRKPAQTMIFALDAPN